MGPVTRAAWRRRVEHKVENWTIPTVQLLRTVANSVYSLVFYPKNWAGVVDNVELKVVSRPRLPGNAPGHRQIAEQRTANFFVVEPQSQ